MRLVVMLCVEREESLRQMIMKDGSRHRRRPGSGIYTQGHRDYTGYSPLVLPASIRRSTSTHAGDASVHTKSNHRQQQDTIWRPPLQCDDA